MIIMSPMPYHSLSLKFFITLAGIPATRVNGGTSWVTMLPAATCAISPIVFPGQTNAIVSTKAPLHILISANMPSPAILGEKVVNLWLPVTTHALEATFA